MCAYPNNRFIDAQVKKLSPSSRALLFNDFTENFLIMLYQFIKQVQVLDHLTIMPRNFSDVILLQSSLLKVEKFKF